MKKSKIAEMPRTPANAMAEKEHEEKEDLEEMVRKGGYDLDDLIRAEEIKKDDGRMKYVKMAADKRAGAIRSIQDLHVAREALAMEKTKRNRYPKREK